MGHLPNPAEIVLVRETIKIELQERYTLVRYYRCGTDTFKVTVHRHDDRARSYATAEIHTASQEWSLVVRNPPANWHDRTFVWGLTSLPAVDPETGFITLRSVADELARDAAVILPA
jgi:hypothetical protein